jgi:hypothetical protein
MYAPRKFDPCFHRRRIRVGRRVKTMAYRSKHELGPPPRLNFKTWKRGVACDRPCEVTLRTLKPESKIRTSCSSARQRQLANLANWASEFYAADAQTSRTGLSSAGGSFSKIPTTLHQTVKFFLFQGRDLLHGKMYPAVHCIHSPDLSDTDYDSKYSETLNC